MKGRYTTIVVASLATALLAGCGGGGGGDGGGYSDPTPPRPTNAAPTIGGLTDQSTDEGATIGPISFTVNDAETSAEALTVVAASSNAALIPANGLELDGVGASRTLTITPATEGAGSADITITVSDAGSARSSATFKLAVNPLLRAQFSTWFRETVLPRAPDANPVGVSAEEGQPLPQVEDINRIRIMDDTAADAQAYDDLLPPPEPTEGSV
jgi:Bacterial Ig domain